MTSTHHFGLCTCIIATITVMFSSLFNVAQTSLLVSVSSSNSTVMAGESITLTCSVTIPYRLNGIPEFQWEGPGETPDPAAPSTSGQEVTSQLTLSAIRTSQAGQCTRTASLDKFDRSDSAVVIVQSKGIIILYYVHSYY